MRPLKATAIALVLVFVVQASWGADRGPSTQEERTKAIDLARQLEQDPLGDYAREARQWLTTWLIEIPDVSVKVCGSLLGPVLGGKKNHASELVTQLMYSSAAFVIEHPDNAQDDLAMYLAGVEGSLRAYESILKSRPKERWKFLDDLLVRRDAGTLKDYVRGAMAECK